MSRRYQREADPYDLRTGLPRRYNGEDSFQSRVPNMSLFAETRASVCACVRLPVVLRGDGRFVGEA